MAEDGDDEASTPLSAKRKLPLLATGGSDDSNSAPQHCSKRRRHCYRGHRFSAPVPSDGELDTGDGTSGSPFVPCRTRRGQGPSEPSRVPQGRRRLTKPHGRRPDAEPTGRRGSLQGCSPRSSRIASPVANRVVVFEQQRWEGEIIEERLVRQETGSPPASSSS